jgi:hypothetical protein
MPSRRVLGNGLRNNAVSPTVLRALKDPWQAGTSDAYIYPATPAALPDDAFAFGTARSMNSNSHQRSFNMNASSTPHEGQSDTQNAPDPNQSFETDISETDDEGTTVRQAEVKPDDLTEVDEK